MKKATIFLAILTISCLFSHGQTPIHSPNIDPTFSIENNIHIPMNLPMDQNKIRTEFSKHNVFHKYYTITDFDINVYGTDVLEIDSYIYLNGSYRDRPPGTLKTSIWKPFTMKLNQQGKALWVRTDSLGIFSQHRTYMRNLIQLADGNILTMGEYISTDTVQKFLNEKTFFIKLDTAGNLIWSKMVGLPDSLGGLLWSLDIVAEPDTGFTTQAYTLSESRTISYDSTSYWGDTTFVSIVKFDKHGNIERMNRFFLGTEKTSVMCSGIIKTDDGGYLLAGHTSFANDPDHHPYFDRKSFIIKVDSLFSKEWTSVFNRCVNFIINKTVINNSSSGGYLFASSNWDTTVQIFNGYIHYGKIDNYGNILWEQQHAKMLHPNGHWAATAAPMGIVDDTLGNVVVATQVNNFSGAYLFCTDTLGNEKWSRWVPYWGEFLYNLRKGESGGYLLTGIGAGAWLAKTDSIGCVLPGCIDTLMHIGMEEIQQLKKEEVIVYPNPSKNEVYVTLTQNTEPIKQIEIFDIHGKMVFMSQPNQTFVTVDVSHLPNGIYLIKVNTSQNVITKKILKH